MDMNNEMDELFRKAGEDYPLNLGKPDWDAVAGKLHTDTGDLGPGFGLAAAAPRKRRRYLWLLLLLLPAGIYGIIADSQWPTADAKSKTADRGLTAEKPAGAPSQTTDRGQQADNTTGDKTQPARGGRQDDKTPDAAVNTDPGTDKSRTGINSPASGQASRTGATRVNRALLKGSPAGSLRGTAPENPATGLAETGRSKPEGIRTTSGKPDAITSGNPRKGQTGKTGNGSDEAPEMADHGKGTVMDGKSADSAVAAGSTGTGTDENSSPLAEVVMADQANQTQAGSDNKAVSVSKEKAAGKTDSAKVSQAVTHPSVKQQRGFYAGVTAAPDFSTVKFQMMKSTGYSFGVVAGYRIDRHFSVETGLSWDRKKYYSKGEYFDKSRTKIPSTVNVTYIDGYCEMFEIPLTLRYDLRSGRKGHWFAAAGFSSYLMKNENYLYGAETNNVAWSRYVDYKNSGNNFFSILQLSAGYEFNWSTRNRIRVEPYFKAPVSGVGIGSLPISSVGMTFGIIHSFR